MSEPSPASTGPFERALLRVHWNRIAEQAAPALRERPAGRSDEDVVDPASEAVEEVRDLSPGDSIG